MSSEAPATSYLQSTLRVRTRQSP